MPGIRETDYGFLSQSYRFTVCSPLPIYSKTFVELGILNANQTHTVDVNVTKSSPATTDMTCSCIAWQVNIN